MAWVRKLADGTYRGAYRDSSGRRITLPGSYTHKANALRAANTAETDARLRRTQDTPLTWGQWVDTWHRQRPIEDSTRKEDDRRIREVLKPKWGDTALPDITRAAVKQWAEELAAYETTTAAGKTVIRKRAPLTVKKFITLLSASLNAAVDQELITTNPAAAIKVRGGEATHERFLTREELDAVAEHMRNPAHKAILYLLANTGLRWGEAAGLQWKRYDPKRQVILVAEVWSDAISDLKPYPKGKRRRTVPAPAWLMDLFEEGDPVLKSPLGARADRRNFADEMHTAADLAGVEYFRVHDLRHTYASWLIQAGIPLLEVGRLMGHESIQTTMRYAHLAEQPTDEVLAALHRPNL